MTSSQTESYASAQPLSWGEYWERYGEQLVWNSWTEKYSDYMESSPHAPPFTEEEVIAAEGVVMES